MTDLQKQPFYERTSFWGTVGVVVAFGVVLLQPFVTQEWPRQLRAVLSAWWTGPLAFTIGTALVGIVAFNAGRKHERRKGAAEDTSKEVTVSKKASPISVARMALLRQQLNHLTPAETAALRYVVVAGHALPNQIAEHVEQKGFGKIDVLASLRSKTNFLVGSFSGDFTINEELSEQLSAWAALIPEEAPDAWALPTQAEQVLEVINDSTEDFVAGPLLRQEMGLSASDFKLLIHGLVDDGYIVGREDAMPGFGIGRPSDTPWEGLLFLTDLGREYLARKRRLRS